MVLVEGAVCSAMGIATPVTTGHWFAMTNKIVGTATCRPQKACRKSGRLLKSVIVWNMLHDILYFTLENIAQLVYGVHFHILIMT